MIDLLKSLAFALAVVLLLAAAGADAHRAARQNTRRREDR